MKTTGRVKPSKPVSVMVMCISFVFIVVGIATIPQAGFFGVLVSFAGVIGVVYHAANLFSEHGAAYEVVEFDTAHDSPKEPAQMSPEQRLRRLEDLKNKNLISADEYETKRSHILDEL